MNFLDLINESIFDGNKSKGLYYDGKMFEFSPSENDHLFVALEQGKTYSKDVLASLPTINSNLQEYKQSKSYNKDLPVEKRIDGFISFLKLKIREEGGFSIYQKGLSEFLNSDKVEVYKILTENSFSSKNKKEVNVGYGIKKNLNVVVNNLKKNVLWKDFIKNLPNDTEFIVSTSPAGKLEYMSKPDFEAS